MKPAGSRGGKPRWGLVLSAALAVALPVTALCLLQYRSLRELEARTRVTIREGLRQSVRGVKQETAATIDRIAAEAFEPLRRVEVDPRNRKPIVAELKRLVEDHPHVDSVLLASCLCSEEAFVAVASADGVQWFNPDNLSEDANGFFRALTRSRPPLDPRISSDQLAYAHEGGETGLYVFRSFAAEGAPVDARPVAGIRIGQATILDLIHGIAFAATSPEPTEEAHLAYFVVGEDVRPIRQTAEGDFSYEVRESLGEPLPTWDLAVGFRGKTVEAMAQEQLRGNLLLMGLALAGLATGLGLTLRAVSRQARLTELKSAFVANVSHEMRTPLSLIRLFSETLELGRVRTPEKIQQYYRIIHRESVRLTQITNNVLDFSRIEAGRKEYQFAECNAGELVRKVLEDYGDPIRRGGFELRTEIAESATPIWADGSAVSQAVLNLVDNAIKYSPERKEIAVRVERRNGSVAIEVEDHGLGIPRVQQDMIFEKFHRAGNALTPATRGSGLGLSLTRHTVEAHGGSIEVESAEGQGSRFTILLPVQAGREA